MSKQELEKNLPILALLAASILGAYVRFFPVLQADLPLNDGSFFVQMTEEILAAGFRLPEYTGYNLSDIPFAYPPLGFYLAALTARITSIDPLQVIRFLPALVSWLTIPAFFVLVKKISNHPLTISAAVVIFALIPRSWIWLVMGGGLTRAPGLLFSILTIYFGYRVFAEGMRFWPAALCFALAALSHPEAVIFSALALGLEFLVYRRDKTGFRDLFLIGLTALLVSSPWWLTVVLRHGFAPFLAAGGTGGFSLGFVNSLILFDLTGETGPALFAILAVLGVFYAFSRKQYFLGTLAIVTVVLLQRSGPNYMVVPAAILAAQALIEVILPGISAVRIGEKPALLGKILLGYLGLNLLFSAFVVIYDAESPLQAISPEEAQAMAWVRENTPAESRFLVLADLEWWNDLHGEWFPYLAERQAVNTLQGSEWLPDDRFNQSLTWRTAARECLISPEGCLSDLLESGIPFEYVFVVKQNELNPLANTLALESELRQDPDFVLVYEGGAGLVFAWQPASSD